MVFCVLAGTTQVPGQVGWEHLGPNDYYYWDDFWGVAGLQAAADWMEQRGGRNALSAPIAIYEVHLGSSNNNAWNKYYHTH